jgi:cell division protein FtsZ
MGKVVLAALVQPLEAEGGSRKNQADTALAEYRESCNAVMLFPLESLKSEEQPGMLLPRLLKRCGMEVSRSLGGLAVLLRSGWLLPLSLQDVVKVMNRADGYCRLVAVSSDTENRVEEVLEKLFTHPLIDKGSLLAHSGGVVLGILCGPKTVFEDLEKISMEVRRVLRSDSELKFGVAQDERFGRYLGLVVMVAERWSTVISQPVVQAQEVRPEGSEENAKGSLIQSEIDLAAPTSGRFKGIQPTIEEGADLDSPTFIRKGIKLSFHKSSRRS